MFGHFSQAGLRLVLTYPRMPLPEGYLEHLEINEFCGTGPVVCKLRNLAIVILLFGLTSPVIGRSKTLDPSRHNMTRPITPDTAKFSKLW